MTIVAVALGVVALVVVLAALSFVRWALRTIDRKERALERYRAGELDRQDGMVERYARLVGQQLEATPRERAAENELAVHQATRAHAMARVIEDPEQAMEYGSPSDARFVERTIFEQLRDRTGLTIPEEFLDEAAGSEFIDIEVDAAR